MKIVSHFAHTFTVAAGFFLTGNFYDDSHTDSALVCSDVVTQT